ncbi:MAG: hypothetical protein AAGA77_24325 [Bacteroidota bacterium]
MKITCHLLLAIFCLSFTPCKAQSYFKNSLELNSDFGLSTNLDSRGRFGTFTFSDLLLITEQSSVRTRNYSIGYTRLFNRFNGLKLSIGRSVFGFSYQGIFVVNEEQTFGDYRVSFLEFGLSYLRRFLITKDAVFLFEPGIRYYSDPFVRNGLLSIFFKNSLSTSLYSGIELPLNNNNIFLNAGIQVKLPLSRYNHAFGDSSPFRPIFVGIKLGINIQFGRSSD